MSAPTYALVAGLVYAALGFAGFADVLPYGTGLSVLHVAVGFWGLFSWSGATSAVNFARGTLAVLAVLAGVALYLGFEGLAALCATSALLSAYIGFRSIARREPRAERRHRSGDRRVAARAVAYERRHGRFDRRQAGFGGSSLAAG